MGGLDSEDNLVLLSAKEHYVAHKLLHYIYPDNKKLSYAWNMMSNRMISENIINVTSREYEECKKSFSKSMLGRKVSRETRDKISKSNKGKVRSEEVVKKMSEARKGYKHKDETKKKISKSNSGKNISKERGESISNSLKQYYMKNPPLKGKNHPNYGRKLSEEKRKELSKNRKGLKNANSKGLISTPFGVFESQNDAAKAESKNQQYISYRLKTDKYKDYFYIKN